MLRKLVCFCRSPFPCFKLGCAITDTSRCKTGFFGWNLATYALREQLNITAQQLDPIEDEFVHAKLEKEDAKSIPVPLVKDSPVRFECQFDRVIELPGNPPMGTVRLSFRLAAPSLSVPLCLPLVSCFLLADTLIKGRHRLRQSPRSPHLRLRFDPRQNRHSKNRTHS